MNGEEWARISLRVASQRLTAKDIEQLMGRASSARSDNPWTIDTTEDTAVALNDQLQTAKEYLLGKLEVLENIPDREVNLSIGWTPRSPQDGVVLDVELIALLARIRCYVLLDTYLD